MSRFFTLQNRGNRYAGWGVNWLANGGKPAQILRVHTTFETLVEEVRTRSTAEKEELKFLLERDLIEQRRRQIRSNHRRSQNELKRGGVKFSTAIRDL